MSFTVWACAKANDEIGAADEPTGASTSSNNSSASTSVTNSGSSSNSSGSGSGGSTGTGTTGAGGQAGESTTLGAAGDSSGSGGSGVVDPDVLANADIVVECFFDNTNEMTDRIFAKFFFVNQSDETLPLDGAELRYWLDPDGVSYTLGTFFAGVDLANKLPDLSTESDGQYDYISLKYEPGGSLPPNNDPNGSESQMQLQSNGGTFDQSNDHSFNARLTTRAPNGNVTFYLGGKLLWGCEPSGVCAGDETGEGGAGSDS